jgi:hypothetical protein
MRKIFTSLLLFPVLCYFLQLCIVGFWYVCPADSSVYDGKSYEIRRGMRDGINFIPILGLLPVSGEPVTLYIKDLDTGEITSRSYDIVYDVHADYHKEFGVEPVGR